MPEPRPAKASPEQEASDEAAESERALDGLKTSGDVEGLLNLAKAYRSGSAPGGRDLERCFSAYRAAAELGSSEAEYAVALFFMSSTRVVPRSAKEGVARLRVAADKGSVQAKIYLGNLYELGIHYRTDPEKAEVWYRSAARTAGVSAEPGSDAYANELAELGCVRYALALAEGGKVSAADQARLLQRARAHGYGLRLNDDRGVDGPTLLDNPAEGDVARVSVDEPTKPTIPEANAGPVTTAWSSRMAIALGAFSYAMLFAITGVAAGYAATLGARELVARGTMLPGLGARTNLVFPLVLVALGVLPTWLVYRLSAVVKAFLIGAMIGGVGWVAWGTEQAVFHPNRSIQSVTTAMAGFLASLLVLGLLDGTKRASRRARTKSTHSFQ